MEYIQYQASQIPKPLLWDHLVLPGRQPAAPQSSVSVIRAVLSWQAALLADKTASLAQGTAVLMANVLIACMILSLKHITRRTERTLHHVAAWSRPSESWALGCGTQQNTGSRTENKAVALPGFASRGQQCCCRCLNLSCPLDWDTSNQG